MLTLTRVRYARECVEQRAQLGRRRRRSFQPVRRAEPVCGIYGIFSSTGGVYIGCSTDIRRALLLHRSRMVRRTHFNPFLQRDWNRGSVLRARVLLQCAPSELVTQKTAFIETRNSRLLYNLPDNVKFTSRSLKKMFFTNRRARI